MSQLNIQKGVSVAQLVKYAASKAKVMGSIAREDIKCTIMKASKGLDKKKLCQIILGF